MLFCCYSYLRKQFGNEEVRVELKKKENRSETGFLTTMNDYLDVSNRKRSQQVCVCVCVFSVTGLRISTW